MAGPLPPALQNLGLVAVTHDRVGKQVVGPGRVMRRWPGLDSRATRAGDGKQCRRDASLGQWPERQLGGGGKAAGCGQGALALERGAHHVGQGIAEPTDELRLGMLAVEFAIQREITDAEVGGQVHDQPWTGVEDLVRDS